MTHDTTRSMFNRSAGAASSGVMIDTEQPEARMFGDHHDSDAFKVQVAVSFDHRERMVVRFTSGRVHGCTLIQTWVETHAESGRFRHTYTGREVGRATLERRTLRDGV